MSALLGIVGKPNAGKSTFFKAATLAEVEAANYPFTTIDANRGIGFVRAKCPCKEFNVDCEPRQLDCEDGVRKVPVQLLDVAGLVPGAYKGRGLGNQFLDQLRRADGLIHVIDASGGTDAEGNPIEVGSRNPEKDVEFLEEEIEKWMWGILEEKLESIKRKVLSGSSSFLKEFSDVFSGLGADKSDISFSLESDPSDWSEKDKSIFLKRLRETIKPLVIAANKVDIADRPVVERLKEKYGAEPVSAESELALKKANESGLIKYVPGFSSFEIVGNVSREQKKGLKVIKEKVLDVYGSTGVQNCIERTVRDKLGKIVVYPVRNEKKLTDSKGRILPDALLVDKGSTPVDVAYSLHTDLGKSFHHSVNVRTGKRIGEDSKLKDGEIIKIVTS